MKKKAKAKKAAKNYEFTLTAGRLARVLDVDRALPAMWADQGAPHETYAHKRGIRLRFSVEAMNDWFAENPRQSECLGVMDRGSKGMKGTWALFRRKGWAAFRCTTCAEFPVMTRARQERGDHVLARIESERVILVGKRSGTVITKVRLRCWCSAKIRLVPLAFVPEPDRSRLLPSPSVEEARRKRGARPAPASAEPAAPQPEPAGVGAP